MPVDLPSTVATLSALAAALTVMLYFASMVARRLRSPALRSAVRAMAIVVLLVAPLAGLVVPHLLTIRSSVPAAVGASVAPMSHAARQVLVTTVPSATMRTMPTRLLLSAALILVWLLGASVVLLRTLVSFAALRVVRRRSRALAVPEDLLQVLRARSGVQRDFRVRISTVHSALGAMTWGVVRPTVMLPDGALLWPSEHRVAVLLHEMAHIRRFDAAWRMLGLAATTIHWFNPLVWQLTAAMHADAELCADDAVLTGGVRPTDYATVMLHLAHTRQPRPSSLVPAFSGGALEMRISRVIAANTERAAPRRAQMVALTLAAASVCALAGAVRAEPMSRRTSPAVFDVAVERRLTTLPARVRRRIVRAVGTSSPIVPRLTSQAHARS